MIDFDYEKLGAGYYDKIFEKRRGMRRFWHEERFAMIETFLTPGPATRILDAGCAAGSFLGRLKKPFGRAVGIDISRAQIDYARKKYPDARIEFIAADVTSFENKEPLYDYIVLSEVLEHVPYPKAVEVLKRLKSFLNPEGTLVVTTPNYRSLWPFLEFLVNHLLPVSYEHQHVNKLDSKCLVGLLKEAGFVPQKVKTFFIFAPFLSMLSYRLARWVGRIESKLIPGAGCLVIAAATPA